MKFSLDTVPTSSARGIQTFEQLLLRHHAYHASLVIPIEHEFMLRRTMGMTVNELTHIPDTHDFFRRSGRHVHDLMVSCRP